jgi:hypothetical protein
VGSAFDTVHDLAAEEEEAAKEEDARARGCVCDAPFVYDAERFLPSKICVFALLPFDSSEVLEASDVSPFCMTRPPPDRAPATPRPGADRSAFAPGRSPS